MRKIVILIFLGLVGCTTHNEESSSESPYALPGLDHGLLQSPINIITDRLTEPIIKLLPIINLHMKKSPIWSIPWR